MLKKVSKRVAILLIKRFIAEELTRKLWFKKIKPFVKAIVLYGSVAKGLNRPDSDIDFLIFVPLRIEKKFTKGEYFYSFENRTMNIVLRSIERLRKIAESQNNEFQKAVFEGSEIIWKKDDEVELLIKKILDNKNK